MGREILERIHHELLTQCHALGFSIESGMAVDVRVVRSASRPVSDRKLRVLQEKQKNRLKKKTQRTMRLKKDVESVGLDGEARQSSLWYEGACLRCVEGDLVLSPLKGKLSPKLTLRDIRREHIRVKELVDNNKTRIR